jgi:hypothetical protein
MTGSPWAVVLAGGDGDRVSALTRDADGRVVPKQYWCCGGRPPMVRWALARARRSRGSARARGRYGAAPASGSATSPMCPPPSGQPENRTAVECSGAGGSGQSAASLSCCPPITTGDEAVLHHALAEAVRASPRSQPVVLGVSPEAAADYG